jgi:hypothetical protein
VAVAAVRGLVVEHGEEAVPVFCGERGGHGGSQVEPLGWVESLS